MGRRGGLGGLEEQGLEVDPFLGAAAALQVELINLGFVHFFWLDGNSIRRAITD